MLATPFVASDACGLWPVNIGAAAFHRYLTPACSPAKAGAQSGSPPSRGNKIGDGLLRHLRATPAKAGAQLEDVANGWPCVVIATFPIGPGLRRDGALKANASVPLPMRGSRRIVGTRRLPLGRDQAVQFAQPRDGLAVAVVAENRAIRLGIAEDHAFRIAAGPIPTEFSRR